MKRTNITQRTKDQSTRAPLNSHDKLLSVKRVILVLSIKDNKDNLRQYMFISVLNLFNIGNLRQANRQISGESTASRWMNGIG